MKIHETPLQVLLTIHVANIKLANTDGHVIAEYPSHRIVYCNWLSSEDKLHFGILTKSSGPDEAGSSGSSNSCHVFKINSRLTEHAVHSSSCASFGFGCTKASELNSACQEFPASCDGLVGAIQTLYIDIAEAAEAGGGGGGLYDGGCSRGRGTASSPQPSNVSTSTNSDSGIAGLKDDCSGCRSERNFNGELPPARCQDRVRDGARVSFGLCGDVGSMDLWGNGDLV